MINFITCMLHLLDLLLGRLIKKDMMGEKVSIHQQNKKCVQRSDLEASNEETI
jgi:hypothetical protein